MSAVDPEAPSVDAVRESELAEACKLCDDAVQKGAFAAMIVGGA